MLLESEFKELTHLFYNGQFHSGLQKLSSLILSYPSHATLYSNRALFYTQLNQDSQAISDLQHSLLLNPMSYVSYFNLFSVQIKNNEQQAAFGNLCCSLSVLYLLRAKIRKSFEDADRALAYAGNNFEARLLKCLMLIEQNRYEAAKVEIMLALEIYPKNPILQNILDEIQKKIDPEYVSSRRPPKTGILPCRRLKSEMQLPNSLQERQEEINAKVEQFNELYNQLNSSYGGVTQKIHKEGSFQQSHGTFMLQKSRASNKSMIAALDDDDFFGDQPNFFENKAKISEVLPIDESQRDGTESEVKIFPSVQTNHIDVIEEHSSKEEISYDSNSDRIPPQSNIYPLKNKDLKLRVSVINFTFVEPQKYDNLDNIYCILSYNKEKLSTTAMPSIEGTCAWNKTFSKIQFAASPSLLKIKLYNKQRSAIRDQFLGDFQVMIDTADLLRLPLFDRDSREIGDMLLHLQAIE